MTEATEAEKMESLVKDFAISVSDQIEMLNPSYNVLMNGLIVLAATYIAEFTVETRGVLTKENLMANVDRFAQDMRSMIDTQLDALLEVANQEGGENAVRDDE